MKCGVPPSVTRGSPRRIEGAERARPAQRPRRRSGTGRRLPPPLCRWLRRRRGVRARGLRQRLRQSLHDDHDTVVANPSLATSRMSGFLVRTRPAALNVSYALDRLSGARVTGYHSPTCRATRSWWCSADSLPAARSTTIRRTAQHSADGPAGTAAAFCGAASLRRASADDGIGRRTSGARPSGSSRAILARVALTARARESRGRRLGARPRRRASRLCASGRAGRST